jgi:CRP-like cAMP-binding protein
MATPLDTSALEGIELFAGLSREELGGIVKECVEIVATSGQSIIEAGQQSQALYVLLAGTAEVDLEPLRAKERMVAELAPGSVFGESSFFHASPHSATVKARTDARVLVLKRDRFDRLLSENHAGALRIASNATAVLAARLQEADRVILELLDQIQDEKVRAAFRNLRSAISHPFSSGPAMYLGTQH